MNKPNNFFIFFDEKDNPINVSFYGNELKIEDVSKDKTYYFNSDDITSFQVEKRYYSYLLMFMGDKIKYYNKGREKKIVWFSISLKINEDIDYQSIFENNSPLKTPMSIYTKRLNEFEEKVYRNPSSKRGTVYLSKCPRFASWTISVDGFDYTKTNINQRVFSFELPYGKYKISYAATWINPDSVIDSGQCSNDVEIELNDFTPEVRLKAKRGFINLKLEVI